MTKRCAEMHVIPFTRCCKKLGRVKCRSLELVEGENTMSVSSQRHDIRGTQNIFPLTQYLGYYRPVSCLAPTSFAPLAAFSMFSIRHKYLSRNSHYSPFMS